MLLEQFRKMGGSITVTWNEQLVLSPQESLAVTLTVVVPTGNVLPLGGLATMFGGGLHPPLALAVKNTVAPLELVAFTTMFDEQFNRIGVFVLTTVTVKLQEALPLSSLASQFTVVVPTGKVLPDDGLAVTVGDTPHVSLAFTLKNTAMGTVEVTTMLDGQLIDTTQFCGSTMTVNSQFVLFPQESLAVTLTEFSPIGNKLPLGGSAVTVGRLQPPLAVTLKNTTAPLELVAFATMFDEQFSTIGGEELLTEFTVTTAEAVLLSKLVSAGMESRMDAELSQVPGLVA
jgi:hypothetical protein